MLLFSGHHFFRTLQRRGVAFSKNMPCYWWLTSSLGAPIFFLELYGKNENFLSKNFNSQNFRVYVGGPSGPLGGPSGHPGWPFGPTRDGARGGLKRGITRGGTRDGTRDELRRASRRAPISFETLTIGTRDQMSAFFKRKEKNSFPFL